MTVTMGASASILGGRSSAGDWTAIHLHGALSWLVLLLSLVVVFWLMLLLFWLMLLLLSLQFNLDGDVPSEKKIIIIY